MIKVMLVDDHALFRQGLREVLAKASDIRVSAEAGSYAQAIEMLRVNDVNVVVADLSMPGRDGIDLISHVRTSSPEVAILVLTMHEDSEYAARALRSGASGYMTKASTSEDLISAIRRIASGRSYVSPSVSENLMERFTRTDSETPPHTTLSHREFRIFELLVQCQTTTRIARELSLSVKTVSTHKTRLLKKMGLQHQGELVRYAIEHKLTGH
jgi:two-component system, NarL family, invasion response regulator UvrY